MVSITRILCPVDFSDCSRRALDYAIAIGRRFGAAIEVLHVTPEVLVTGRAELQMQLDRLRSDAHAEVVAQTKRLIDSIVAPGLRVEARVERGNPATQIVALAGHAESTLVVMGTHGRTGIQRFMLGSVVDKVLRLVQCPMLTVPPLAIDPRAERMFSRVLCPIDFSEPSASALHFAVSMTGKTNGRLMVLHAVEPQDEPLEHRGIPVPDLRQELHDDAQDRVRTLLAGAHYAQAPEVLIVVGKAYVEILRVTAERNVDTIVMGVRGRGAIDRLLLGSTTEHVVRAATCPVLTVRRD
jgi:nucleotide-binding universal stress UspA family protein